MTVLITGGTGKTGLALARFLIDANYNVLLTSRSGKAPEPFKCVSLDWWKPNTFNNPFDADATIDTIYLVGPLATLDTLTPTKPFIDLAVSKGVKRIVLLSASPATKGSLSTGQLHEYLDVIGVEYVALRPTGFMDNFASLSHLSSIRDDDQIVSVAKEGRIPFVSADDIARAALDAISSEKILRNDVLVLGPELFSYDEVAAILSELLGRKITHQRVTVDEKIKLYTSFGTPVDYATLLVNLEAEVAEGSEEAHLKADNKIIGRTKLRDWLPGKKQLWMKPSGIQE